MVDNSVSCKHLCFGDAVAKLNERYSCLKLVRVSEHVALFPRCVDSPKHINNGIKRALDAKLNKYFSKYSGIPITYDNVTCLDSAGRIFAGNCMVHFNITLDFIIFCPQIGSLVSGIVNKISAGYLGVLVHNTFNAAIEMPCGLKKKNVKDGQEVIFEITKINTLNFLPVINGKLSDGDYKERNDSSIRDNVPYVVKPDLEASVTSGKSRKRNLSISEFEHHELDIMDNSYSGKKKKKHSSHNEAGCNGETINSFKAEHSEGTELLSKHSKKKKKKDAEMDMNDCVVAAAEKNWLEASESGIQEIQQHLHKSDLCEGNKSLFNDTSVIANSLKKKKKRHFSHTEMDNNDLNTFAADDENWPKTPESGRKIKHKDLLKSEPIEGNESVIDDSTTFTDSQKKKRKKKHELA